MCTIPSSVGDFVTSTNDPCLLLSTGQSVGFGLVGMQTDDLVDTLMLCDAAFATKEEDQLQEANPKQNSELFYQETRTLTPTEDGVRFVQKGQSANLALMDLKNDQDK